MIFEDCGLRRAEALIAWYDKKATWDKRWYIGLRVAESAIAALITIGTGFLSGELLIRTAVAVGGALLVVIGTLCSVCRYEDNWRSARLACEGLTSERCLYLARSGCYLGEEGPLRFAEKVEEIAAGESKYKSNF